MSFIHIANELESTIQAKGHRTKANPIYIHVNMSNSKIKGDVSSHYVSNYLTKSRKSLKLRV